MLDSSTLDQLDAQIVRALQVAPRAPFSLIADVLDVSEQTVARRYRRLGREGVLRIIGVVNPNALGQSSWMVRIQSRPSGTESLANALAQRDDVGWVTLSAGGSEVVCAVRSRTQEARDDLLVQRLPRTTPVLAVAAAVVLHRFVGGGGDDWAALAGLLTEEQTLRLRPPIAGRVEPAAAVVLEPSDEPMLDVLARDGRATYAVLAAAAGISEGRAMRRLNMLLERGVAYLDIDLSAAALGFNALANLWLTVTPSELENAGNALSREQEVAFAAAISGPHNLTAAVTCRDLDALYRFITTKVGAIAGVQSMEVSPVLRHVKQAGALVAGDRLGDTVPPKPRRR
jgi:DNA-binding Lrp family transcriptional regulator